MSKVRSLAVAAAASVVSGVAAAQSTAPDVTSVTDVIAQALTAGAAIGLAVLGMHYGIKLYKWIKAAG